MVLTKDDLKEINKLLTQQRKEIKNEWFDLFAEAFQGMINPVLKVMGKGISVIKKDIHVIKKDISVMKEDIQVLKNSTDTIERKLDKFDDKIWEQQESIKKLEKIHPSGQHAVAN